MKLSSYSIAFVLFFLVSVAATAFADVKSLRGTWFGDGNLDGKFDSTDLVESFSAGRYERPDPATWAQGDWNGNGLFDSSDLVIAFSDGGYEKGPRAARAVPEPTSFVLMVFGAIGIAFQRRRRATWRCKAAASPEAFDASGA